MKPCTSSSSSLPTPSGLNCPTLSLMQLESPWGTSWCMTSFNSTTARSRASVPPYGSLGLAVSTKWKSGRGSYLKWWVGLSLQEVGGAVTPRGGWGYHFKKWVWLLISLSGQGYHRKWWAWSSSQVVGMLPHQGVGGALTSRGGWGCRHPIRLCHLTLIKCHWCR